MKKTVLYFLFEIVVWIQAKNKVSCPYFEQTWCEHNIVLVVDPRACAQQHFSFYSTVIIYKQRARCLSLCCANWLSTLSTLISFSLWMRNIANDERRWSDRSDDDWTNHEYEKNDHGWWIINSNNNRGCLSKGCISTRVFLQWCRGLSFYSFRKCF